jgi:glycosyltransferase involved in cell wall biosynthesis
VNIVQITPGTGGSYCGNCIRDNALVVELRKLGHAAMLLPMYLPITADEPVATRGTPIFFSGINVFLEQQGALLRAMPPWLHRLFSRRWLLKLVGKFAAKTRPDQVGDLTISMLQGEHGNQSRELDELVAWLKNQPKPDVFCLSNILLLGLARRLRQAIGSPVVCLLSGEEAFLDALPTRPRAEAWKILADNVRDADLYLCPSRYYADRMSERLRLAPDRIRVVPPGINLEGFEPAKALPPGRGTQPPVLGYFARLCQAKGLDQVVDAFLMLKTGNRVPGLRLKVGGYCSPTDRPFVRAMHRRLSAAGVLGETEFHANLDRAGKIAFLQSLTVFSVPAMYGDPFGLYVPEAMAAGVPVVQPRVAAFPEILEPAGGGELYEPHTPAALAATVEALLLDPTRLETQRRAARQAAQERFSARRMAEETARAFAEVVHDRAPAVSASAR